MISSSPASKAAIKSTDRAPSAVIPSFALKKLTSSSVRPNVDNKRKSYILCSVTYLSNVFTMAGFVIINPEKKPTPNAMMARMAK
jgi:hypothetical protein